MESSDAERIMFTSPAGYQMTKRTKRIQQLVVGLFAVLSLMVSSVASCACSHHEPVAESKKSCHETAHHDTDSQTADSQSIEETCFCIRPSDERSVKSESFKLKKLTPLLVETISLEPARAHVAVIDPELVSRKPFFGRVVYPSVLSRGPPAA